MKTVLVTGCYGFIGYSLCMNLLKKPGEYHVIGIDKVRDAISHKEARMQNLSRREFFTFLDLNLSDFDKLHGALRLQRPDVVIHLAGQYSVMHNTQNMLQYTEGNLVGFNNLIECAKLMEVPRFIYASSTWVQDGEKPTSLYWATKMYNENCAHVYSSQFGMTTVGLRIASTYGPFVRPDIGMYQVMRWLMNGTPINLDHPSFKGGIGFVHIDDVVKAIHNFMLAPLELKYNVHTIVADDAAANMSHVLEQLELYTGKKHVAAAGTGPLMLPKREINGKAMREIVRLEQVLGWAPRIILEHGIHSFVEWFNSPENIPPN